MKIVVAGTDRTAEIGARLQATAGHIAIAPRKPAQIEHAISSLRLADTTSESHYHQEFLRLLRYRDNVDTLPFVIPRKPGLIGGLIAKGKARLWSLLRYQHDRITFRQNLINNLYTSALELEYERRQREIAQLSQRLTELEARLSNPSAAERGAP